jgi:hypothetical protein
VQVNAVMHKTYNLVCQLPAQTASERIEGLLSKEGVKYRAADLSIASIRTPIAVLSIQPKLYSQSNWVGLNPFVYISRVDVLLKPRDGGVTGVTVRVDRLRAFLFAALGIACSLPAASAMPEPAGVLFFVGFACVTWFGVVSFLGGYLIKKEISECLKDGAYDQPPP